MRERSLGSLARQAERQELNSENTLSLTVESEDSWWKLSTVRAGVTTVDSTELRMGSCTDSPSGRARGRKLS